MTTENYYLLRDLTTKDVTVLEEKGKSYGSSWRKRGGVGAFMMLARKWDRIENQMEAAGYDIFEPLRKEMVAGTTDGLLDDIRDLRRYLLLVEGHVMNSMTMPRPGEHGHPYGTTEDRSRTGVLQGKPHLASAHLGGGVYGAVCSECNEAPEKCRCGEPGRGYVNQDPDTFGPNGDGHK